MYVVLQRRAQEYRRRAERQRELLLINPHLVFEEDIRHMDWEEQMYEENEIEQSKTYPDDDSSNEELG